MWLVRVPGCLPIVINAGTARIKSTEVSAVASFANSAEVNKPTIVGKLNNKMQVLKKKNQKKTILNLWRLRELPPLISYSIADLKVSGLEEGVSGEIKVLTNYMVVSCYIYQDQ